MNKAAASGSKPSDGYASVPETLLVECCPGCSSANITTDPEEGEGETDPGYICWECGIQFPAPDERPPRGEAKTLWQLLEQSGDE